MLGFTLQPDVVIQRSDLQWRDLVKVIVKDGEEILLATVRHFSFRNGISEKGNDLLYKKIFQQVDRSPCVIRDLLKLQEFLQFITGTVLFINNRYPARLHTILHQAGDLLRN